MKRAWPILFVVVVLLTLLSIFFLGGHREPLPALEIAVVFLFWLGLGALVVVAYRRLAERRRSAVAEGSAEAGEGRRTDTEAGDSL